MEIKEQLKELEHDISKGLAKAFEKTIKLKKEKKSPLIVSENGKIVKICPDEL